MPTSNSGLAIGGSSLNPKINNPKRATISVAANGFVISFQKVEEYGESYKVAKDVSEIPDMLTSYFSDPTVIEA